MRIFATCAAALLMSGSAQALTIVNGSFELGTFTGASFDTLAAGNANITGWTIGGAGVDWIGNYWQAAVGNRSIDLSALSAGSLSQSIATEVGKRYVVTFAMAGNPDGGPNPKIMNVSANGAGVAPYSFTTGATTRPNMGWVDFSYSFIANSATTTLAFTSTATTPSGPALDNVRISVVPEASTWAMLIAGFGLVGAASRRRRGRSVLA